jgi:hypothetical protein
VDQWRRTRAEIHDTVCREGFDAELGSRFGIVDEPIARRIRNDVRVIRKWKAKPPCESRDESRQVSWNLHRARLTAEERERQLRESSDREVLAA